MANINSTHISDLYPCTVTNVDSLLVKARERALLKILGKLTWEL